jgi:hypothetical protein
MKKASQSKAVLRGFLFSRHQYEIIAQQIVGSLRTRSLASCGQNNMRIGLIGVLASCLPNRFTAEQSIGMPSEANSRGSAPHRA